jgi:hypothetical protein
MELCSIPVTKLKFPSIVITSNDDPYINAQRAEFSWQKWKIGTQISEIRTSQCSITDWVMEKMVQEILDRLIQTIQDERSTLK